MLSPLFELDPLFRRTFLLVVPCRAFGKIASSGRFAPVEIYTTLARILSEKTYIVLEEVCPYVFSIVCLSSPKLSCVLYYICGHVDLENSYNDLFI